MEGRQLIYHNSPYGYLKLEVASPRRGRRIFNKVEILRNDEMAKILKRDFSEEMIKKVSRPLRLASIAARSRKSRVFWMSLILLLYLLNIIIIQFICFKIFTLAAASMDDSVPIRLKSSFMGLFKASVSGSLRPKERVFCTISSNNRWRTMYFF